MGYYAPLLTKRQSEVKHCFSEDKSSRPPAWDRRAGQGGPGSLSKPWFFPGHRVAYTVRRNLLVECCGAENVRRPFGGQRADRKSTRLNSSHPSISYAVFCLKK